MSKFTGFIKKQAFYIFLFTVLVLEIALSFYTSSAINEKNHSTKQEVRMLVFLNAAQQLEMVIEEQNKKDLVIQSGIPLSDVIENTFSLANGYTKSRKQEIIEYYFPYDINKEDDHYVYLYLKNINSDLCQLSKKQKFKSAICTTENNIHTLKYKLFDNKIT